MLLTLLFVSLLVFVVVRVLPGFERDVLRGRATEVQVLVDGAGWSYDPATQTAYPPVPGEHDGDEDCPF